LVVACAYAALLALAELAPLPLLPALLTPPVAVFEPQPVPITEISMTRTRAASNRRFRVM
jgi:hypothetical protein